MNSSGYIQNTSACCYFVKGSTKIERVNMNKKHDFLIPYILSQTRDKRLYWSYPKYRKQ